MYEGKNRRATVEVEKAVLDDIQRSLYNIDVALNNTNTGLCVRQNKMWKTIFGNGDIGLCERMRFLNWKVTFFSGAGVGLFFLIRFLFEKWSEGF